MRLLLTSRELGMQERLFRPDMRRLPPVSDAAMVSVLRALRTASALNAFRLWLVGSRLQPGKVGSDIDVVLSPRSGALPTDDLIEHALWYCREYGLYYADPPCVIDPCFRILGPSLAMLPLGPHLMIKTVKLLSPRVTRLVTGGRIGDYRRLGDIGIEFSRRADETSYYGKLPNGYFNGSLSPYLRPAVEIPIAEHRGPVGCYCCEAATDHQAGSGSGALIGERAMVGR